jgi:aryl-alcohol dehydrogenase-like predicted oxidoreductase
MCTAKYASLVRTRRLGGTELAISVVGLGCNNFGGRIDEDASRAVIDAALDSGVTFFDTADVYGQNGGGEEIIGRALAGRRDRVVLATKFGSEMGDGETARGARPYVRKAVQASLRRLQTDWIDLYQYHRPDGVTPIEETLGALDELVQDGTVRAIGSSNFSAQLVEEAHAAAAERGLTPFATEQSQYSWLRRDAERELLPTCDRLGVGFIPYFPLASGLLTGKVGRDRPPAPGTRLHGRELDDAELDRVERLSTLAAELRVSLLELAVGGLAAQPAVLSVIAGATKPEQVRANAEAGRWEPSDEALAALRSF